MFDNVARYIHIGHIITNNIMAFSGAMETDLVSEYDSIHSPISMATKQTPSAEEVSVYGRKL